VAFSEGRHAFEPQAPNALWQGRIGEQLPAFGIGLDAEHRAHEERHRTRSPRLRAARPRQLDRLGDLVPRVAREDFR
jgi:hypothetical protein